MKISCAISSKEQLNAVLGFSEVSGVILDLKSLPLVDLPALVKKVQENQKKVLISFPPIFRKQTEKRFLNVDFNALEVDGYLVHSLEILGFLRNHQLKGIYVSSENLYGFNSGAKQVLHDFGFDRITAPLELNYHELKEVDFTNEEMVVYGRIPLMVTQNCVQKTTGGCNQREEQLVLVDRKNKSLPVVCYCKDCYNIIYNSAVYSLLDRETQVKSLNCSWIRLNFTLEEEKEVLEVLDRFIRVYVHGESGVSNIPDFTRGHFKKGVE